MATLQIRDLDDEVYHLLKELAKTEHRSLAKQAAAILERAVSEGLGQRARRRGILDRIASEPALEWPESLESPADLIREDRDR